MNENNGTGTSGGPQFDEEMCERYIFGELSPADQEKFEENYFSDDAFFERYIAVKTELLDLLARGELSPEKGSRMEPHFRETAPRRKRIEETAIFSRSVTAIAQRRAGRAPALAALPHATNEGFAAGLIRSLSRFFMSPRVAAFTALVLAIAGGIYLMNRSFSRDTRQEFALVSDDPIQREGEQTAESSEPAIRDKDPGTESAPMTILSSERSVDDEQTLMLWDSKATRSSKRLSKVGERTRLPSPSPTPPTNERAATGFALTLSTIGRDNGREPSPVETTGLNIGGQRGQQTSPAEGLSQSIVLHPGTTRDGGQTDTLVLRSGNSRDWAAITLLFRGEPYAGYDVTITHMAGRVVLKHDDPVVERRADGSYALTVRINDTSGFRAAEKDYIITLRGQTKGGAIETIEEYYFHVRRISAKPSADDGKLLAAPPPEWPQFPGRPIRPEPRDEP